MAEGSSTVNPCDAFNAEVPATSATIAISRQTHFIGTLHSGRRWKRLLHGCEALQLRRYIAAKPDVVWIEGQDFR